jgi:hypothetical protein
MTDALVITARRAVGDRVVGTPAVSSVKSLVRWRPWGRFWRGRATRSQFRIGAVSGLYQRSEKDLISTKYTGIVETDVRDIIGKRVPLLYVSLVGSVVTIVGKANRERTVVIRIAEY